jgi:ATP-dependent DNA helicase DinG
MGAEIPAPDRYIDAVFGEFGYLSRAFPRYRPRPGQIALAQAVDRAIGQRTHLLAEAGTGVGKSLGYATPASYWAALRGRPVVIVTANIALQEQIVTKDLPLLQRIVPWHFTFALLKGRNNYLCADRYYKHKAETFAKQTTREPTAEYRRQLPIVEDWAAASIEAGVARETGDVSELPFEPLHALWQRFSVGSDECKGKRCKHARDCFPNAASELARQSMVIVTNYHMLYAHLAVYLNIGKDVVISPFEVAILDEAHRAADIARDVFGFKVTQETLRRFGRKVDEADRSLLESASAQFFFAMGALARNRDRYKSRLTGDFVFEERNAWKQLSERLDTVRRTLSTRATVLQLEFETLSAAGYGLSDEAGELADRLGEAENLRDHANTAKERLAHAMTPTEHPDEVFFVEEDEKGRISIGSKLITPSLVLTPGLFDKHAVDSSGQVGPRVAVIGTSATLATSEGFGFVAGELGCETYDALLAPSPFDFPNQCLFISPAGMPDPNAPEFPAAVADAFARIVDLAGGRTLGLFTSHRMLQTTFDALVPLCIDLDITLLRQGDAPRTKLIAQFKEDITSVLLGTESFWAGVDVPGEALSVVVIDRLPFPTPADPVLDVLASKDDRWFQHYSLPRAMIAFKQGFGRLIRSLECRGVVVCLDNRIALKRYGKDFLRSMPPGIPKSTRLEAIGEWLYPELPEPAIAPNVGAWDEP